MRTSLTIFLSTLLSLPIFSQSISSPPFALVLQSANSTLDNTYLTTCHEGAAIEGLCPTYQPFRSDTPQTMNNTNVTVPFLPTFTFNTTVPFDSKGIQAGYVIYTLHGGNFDLSSPLKFAYTPTSNVALPLFTSDYGDSFVFDECGLLGVQGFIDDSAQPVMSGQDFIVRRWAICETYYGYRYTTLAWVMGTGEPQNPTCQLVEVKRILI